MSEWKFHPTAKYFYKKVVFRAEDLLTARQVEFRDEYSGRLFKDIGGTDHTVLIEAPTGNTSTSYMSSTHMPKDEMEQLPAGEQLEWDDRPGVFEIWVLGATVDDYVEIRAW